jgi:hypothetical protein
LQQVYIIINETITNKHIEWYISKMLISCLMFHLNLIWVTLPIVIDTTFRGSILLWTIYVKTTKVIVVVYVMTIILILFMPNTVLNLNTFIMSRTLQSITRFNINNRNGYIVHRGYSLLMKSLRALIYHCHHRTTKIVMGRVNQISECFIPF